MDLKKEMVEVPGERILARSLAAEMTLTEIAQVSGAMRPKFGFAATSYDTCSGGETDACDID